MTTRTLLTSLSPHPTYALGNALAVSEQHADHAATLLCPPRVEIVRLRDEPWMQQQLQSPQPAAAAQDVTAALAVPASPSSNSSSRWYALYSASDTLSFRELDASREDYNSECVYSTAFNVQPTCAAIRNDEPASTRADEAAISRAGEAASETEQPGVGISCESLLCVSGFSNGALMVLNPFLEKLRAAAGLNQPSADADSTVTGGVSDSEAQATSAAAAAAVGLTEASVAAISALRDRTFNTAPTVQSMRVNCVCWVPALSNCAVASSSSQPSQQFIAGMSDGRLLVYDLRVDEERRLDHPPFSVASLDPESAAANATASLLSTSTKHKKDSSKVAPASAVAAAFATASIPAALRIIPARQMFHVLQSPLQPAASGSVPPQHASATGSAPPLHASNPIMSWQIFTPPNPPAADAGAAAATTASPAAAATAASGSSSSSSSAAASASSLLSSSINVDASAVSVLVVEFSVSGAFLAVSLSSGHILVLEWSAAPRLVICFKTLYAPALSLAWTADERFLLSGGEEDLLCVWDPFVARMLVLVGEGHNNFITGVRCRPKLFNQTQADVAVVQHNGSNKSAAAAVVAAGGWDSTYRVVSVGQDKLLLFWEFQMPAAVTEETTAAAADERHALPSRATSAATARRSGAAGEEPSDRPSPSAATTAASAYTAASPFPPGTYSDLSPQLIPAPRRSSVRTIYPMARNMVADRAVAWIAAGADSGGAKAREQQRIWATHPPPRMVARALGFASAEAASAACAAVLSAAGSAAAASPSFVSSDSDVLATICHGLRLRFWTRAMAESADEDGEADEEDGSRSTLAQRFTRLHTPVMSRVDSGHDSAESAAAARRVARGPQAPVVRK